MFSEMISIYLNIENSVIDDNAKINDKFKHTSIHVILYICWCDIRRIYIFFLKLVCNNYFGFTWNEGTDGKNAMRLSGYSILISNDSWPNSSCYKDPKSPNLTSLNENDCKATTQYIWFYQQYRAPYDCAPILEICEVQVFGMVHFLREMK